MINTIIEKAIYLSLAQGIIFWGVFYWVPKITNYYGVHFFHWPAPAKFSKIKKIWSSLILNYLNYLIFLKWGPAYLLLGAPLLVSLFGIMFADFRLHIIPDRFQMVGFLSALILFVSNFELQFLPSLIQGLSLSLIAFSAGFIYQKIRKHEDSALGFGDVKLLLWQGVFLGQYVWSAFLIAVLLAVVFVLPKVFFKGSKWSSSFAFAPYLVSGFILQAILGHNVFTL